jgi:hypothetical protein
MRIRPTILRNHLLLGLAVFALSGCGGRTPLPMSSDGRWLPSTTGEGLVAKAGSPIPDVPMPIGFVGIASESHASIEAGIRRVRHVYQGRADVEAVARFYRRQAQLHQWQSLDGRASASLNHMTFAKGNEKLWLHVDRVGAVTSITITIDDRRLDAVPAPLADDSN